MGAHTARPPSQQRTLPGASGSGGQRHLRDPRRPFSDEQLARRLARAGFVIARRTIAKYREEEGILPSRLRRRVPVVKTAMRELAAVAAR